MGTRKVEWVWERRPQVHRDVRGGSEALDEAVLRAPRPPRLSGTVTAATSGHRKE